MERAFMAAVRATIVCRAAEANKSGFFSNLGAKQKGVKMMFLTEQLISGFRYNGSPLSKEEDKLVREWIVGTAIAFENAVLSGKQISN